MLRLLLAILLLQPAFVVPQVVPQESAVQDPAPAAETDGAGSAAEPEPAPRRDSPFDYEASEEISEDLSVSFPVDI